MSGNRKKKRPGRHEAEEKRRISPELMKLLAIGAVVAVGAVAVLLLFNPSSSDAPGAGLTANTPGPDAASVLVREDSPRIESPGASLTLVEFLDFECEVCMAMYPTVKTLLQEYEGRINFVVRYFPLHGNSVLAAKAAEAAGRQGKFWEMHDMLFENQDSWGHASEPRTEMFIEYARSLGLDTDRFAADLDDPELDAKVERDRRDGITAGVRGTPTFFVNGRYIGNTLTLEQFRRVLDTAPQ